MTATTPFDHAPPARRSIERLWDAGALLLITAGGGLFFFARHALQSIASGRYAFRADLTAVSQTDAYVLQSQIGVLLVAVGVGVAALSAWRFRRRH